MYHIMINKINDLISISLYQKISLYVYTDVLQDHIDYIENKSLLVQI